MKERRNLQDWLPITMKEVKARGWEELDVILFSGDAYVDHPAFGPAVIGRLIEAEGYRVAIVPQPNWQDDLRDFKKWVNPGFSSALPRAVWIRWSIIIQLARGEDPMMHIPPGAKRDFDRIMQPMNTPGS
jgi:hypothetical protein